MGDVTGGQGVRISAGLRAKVNAYLGAEVLTKSDEGRMLVDRTEQEQTKYAGNAREYGARSQLSAAGDGIVGIAYDGKAEGLEKLVRFDGKVTSFFCKETGLTAWTQTRVCKQSLDLDYVASVDPQKASCLIAALFGIDALSEDALDQITDPKVLEGALELFSSAALSSEVLNTGPAVESPRPIPFCSRGPGGSLGSEWF